MAQCVTTRFMRVSHVIFDLDGLLLDTERLYSEVIQNVLNNYGKTLTWDVKVLIMGMPAKDGSKHIVKAYDLPITAEEFTKLHQETALLTMGKAQLMPGAERLIRHLHEYKVPMALATSSAANLVAIKTAKYKELFGYLQHLVCGGSDPEVKNGKPAPDIFLIAASRFVDKPCPRKCLVFEDAPNGVQAARSACMQCVMVPDERVPQHMRSKASLVLKSLCDFKPEEFGLPPFQVNPKCVHI